MRTAINFLFGALMRRTAKDFDARFYLAHHEDLTALRTPRQALNHYLAHGKAEGRFANEAAYLAHVQSLTDGFDVAAYRFHNKDLAQRLDTDEEFIRHYVRHGHREERRCRFDDPVRSRETLVDADKWKSIFSPSQFLAWCGDELDPLPATRDQAIAAFIDEGIEKLYPINLDYAFDPAFVRENALLPGHRGLSDADLYRSWLTEGFPAGIAPNERIFLAPYLGGVPSPSSLDWQRLGRMIGTGRRATRSQIIVALFDQPARKIMDSIDLMGEYAAWLLDRIGRRALATGDVFKAKALFTQAVAIAPTAESLCRLGDAHRMLGETEQALEAYRASANIPGAPFEAFLEAATILASRTDFSGAFAILRNAHPVWRQKAAFARALDAIVQRYFDHHSARAHALYQAAAGHDTDRMERRDADALLTAALDEIRAHYAELDRLPAPTGGNPDGYVSILANDDLRQCSHYRIEQKVLAFERAGIPVRVFSHVDVEGFLDSLIGARAAIFYRVGAIPPILRAILHANAMALDTWYEVDDLIFDSTCYPDPIASFEGQVTATQYASLQFGVPLFRYALSMCKAAIASTPALLERMQDVVASGTGVVLRNGLDARNAVAARLEASPMPNESGRVRLFYGSGTKAHNADFNRLVAPALVELMGQHQQIDLVIIGHLELAPELGKFGERIFRYPFTTDVAAYWSILATCDINIAVLEPGAVADCKSEIKWLEAAVLQLPSVTSGTRTYRETIEDGYDGLVADTVVQWREALNRLVTQPVLRERIGQNARSKALRHYDLDVGAAVLQSIFGAADCADMGMPSGRLRVLICNVFFAPQSYGGATRVVEDNVRILVDAYPDLDIAVFCSDEGSDASGRLRMDEEMGVPVYRLATVHDARSDWTPFNDEHAAPFERVLNHFHPDVIHFHCIQRLSATIVAVAQARAIPYVVTLHDGWWISDDQFLIDADGLVHLPGHDVLQDCAKARDPLAATARRRQLASLLHGARATLSVSSAFARIYADAGIDGCRVVENGVSPLGEIVRSPRIDGRIALGHIGGRSAHKGAALLEAVLRRGRYANLHLTMVDGSLTPGEGSDTIWGTTPVTLTAPYPQAQVAALYGRLDVLLAPSIWPESYGLVTREATAAGLWVVASDRGAIADGIEEGLNGNVITVATPAALAATLSAIDADPDRYRARSAAASLLLGRTRLRRTAEQAAELHTLYREFAASPLARG